MGADGVLSSGGVREEGGEGVNVGFGVGCPK